jgi:alpha-D-xyloside xylohydrolase
MMRKISFAILITAMTIAAAPFACGQTEGQRVVMERGKSTIVFEPYAPNIVRVTLSLLKDPALAAPGYGFVASPSSEGWSHEKNGVDEVYKSSRLVVTLKGWHAGGTPPPQSVMDPGKYFSGSTPGADITFTTPDGKTLAELNGWSMSVPNHKDGNSQVLYDRRPTDPDFYQVGASFVSPDDEHYYGLGQNQEGYLDHRGHVVHCWHDYNAPGGQSVCVPFMVTNYGYGIVWDNPSKTTVAPHFNERTSWSSEVGSRVSFFLIAGKTTDEIYAGYRQLTGATPLLPKAAYGYIQCKQRYRSQDEVLAVARGYRERHLPADVIVVDWFYYTKMGQMDFVHDLWPDPTAMNQQLHQMGFQTMISVWPRFESGSRYYDFVLKKGWFEHLADGTPTNGLPYDKAGSDIDTTNPDAAHWYWNTIKENILSKGFDSIWADETEPDLPPNGSYLHIGPGTQFFNVYPLFHTGVIFDGFRRDTPHRGLVLSRDAYLGAQRNGAIFWSSDITATWDAFKRQVPTGLDFAASGLTYWSNDTGGWQAPPAVHHPEHPPLIDPSDVRDNVGDYDDFPELYTRWFEYASFLPIFRTHGSRRYNEVWSYGKQAEPILEKYLKLRYELLPYIYSLGYQTYQTGAPFMRALFMDFPGDSNVSDIRDEYMLGPAFLVAPITDQGTTSRKVYLPVGADWYNYWTNERVKGGQTITVDAPIDTIPVFARAGSIIPTGSYIESTSQTQQIAKVRVYPGSDADFTLFQDDGNTYAYEKGDAKITRLHWSDASHQLTHEGAQAWNGSDAAVIDVIGK